MLQPIMVGPFGSSFRKDIKKAKRSLFLWTVNDVKAMKWSIRNGVDGVITDDPKKYLEVCETYDGEPIHFSLLTWIKIIILNIMFTFAGAIMRWRDHNVKIRAHKMLEV